MQHLPIWHDWHLFHYFIKAWLLDCQNINTKYMAEHSTNAWQHTCGEQKPWKHNKIYMRAYMLTAIAFLMVLDMYKTFADMLKSVQYGVPVVLTLLASWKTQIINFQETSNQHLNYPSVGKAHRSSKNILDKWGKKWNLVDNWHRRRIGYYEISPSWKLWPWYDLYNILCMIYHVYILKSRLQFWV